MLHGAFQFYYIHVEVYVKGFEIEAIIIDRDMLCVKNI